jgi:hypothetical protein
MLNLLESYFELENQYALVGQTLNLAFLQVDELEIYSSGTRKAIIKKGFKHRLF